MHDTQLQTRSQKMEIAVLESTLRNIELERERRKREAANPQRVQLIQPQHVAFAKAYPLRDFIYDSFNELYPGQVYKNNWHIDAISELLQAATLGQVKKFIINIPRRCSKSSLVCINWFVWSWTFLPHTRWLYTSYNADFAKRDNVNSNKLIKSAWYQARFGDRFKITTDTLAKFENDKGGARSIYKIGKGTGDGGHFVLCLWYNTLITTDRGLIKIGDIVENKLDVQVLSYNHGQNIYEWKPIRKYEKSDGRKSVQINFSNASVQCTSDHPFYVEGKGYVEASQLRFGDKVITDGSQLQNLQYRSSAQSEGYCEKQDGYILFPQMLCQRTVGQEQSDVEAEKISRQVQNLRGEGLQTPCAFSEELQGDLLLQNLFRKRAASENEQSMARRWMFTAMQNLRARLSSKQKPTKSEISAEVLFEQMQREIFHGFFGVKDIGSKLRLLWKAISSGEISNQRTEFLQSRMRRLRTSWKTFWKKQRQICSWKKFGRLFSGLPENCSANSFEGFQYLSLMRFDPEREWSSDGCSSHQLRQRPEYAGQFDQPVSIPSWANARFESVEKNLPDVFVISVEEISTPESVYNIEIPENHNYFANGILAHNCDDPNSIDQAESELVSTTTANGWSEVSYHNIIDPETAVRGIIQQRCGEDDLTGHLLRGSNPYELLCLPMMFEEDHPHRQSISKPLNLGLVMESDVAKNPNLVLGAPKFWIDPRDKDAPKFDNDWFQNWYAESYVKDSKGKSEGEGELLWKSRFSRKNVEEMISELKVYGESSQMQQRPVKRGGNFLHSKDFRVLTPAEMKEFDFNNKTYCRYWDKAGSEDSGDFTVGMLVCRNAEQPYYFHIVDIIRKQIGYYERMELMKETAKQDTIDYVLSKKNTEYSIGVEREGASSGKDLATLERDALAGYDVFIETPKGKKEHRAKLIQNRADAGRIALLRGKWNNGFLYRVERYDPSKPKNVDDEADTLSGCLRKLLFGTDGGYYSTSGG